MHYTGEAEYETIAEIKQAVHIPVMANGDITDPEKAKKVLSVTGADALMIGRAAQGRPWIFKEILHYLETGEKLPEPTPKEVGSILIAHLEQLYEHYGERDGVRIARKHLGWYAKDREEHVRFRAVVNRAETALEQMSYARQYFELLEGECG